MLPPTREHARIRLEFMAGLGGSGWPSIGMTYGNKERGMRSVAAMHLEIALRHQSASKFPSVSRLLLLLLMLTLVGVGCNSPLRPQGEFVERSVQYRGVVYRYQVFLPTDEFTGKRPVVMFLHGKGEFGYDGEKPTLVGLGPYVRANADTFPAIAVFPQAPDNTQWMGEVNQIALLALEATLNEFDADADRVYLTGLSMGAFGTWLLAMDHPDRFAAIVPVCNNLIASEEHESNESGAEDASPDVAVDPLLSNIAKVQQIPIWIFHGGKDDLVPPVHARRMFAALKAIDARDVRYTEFPDANHNCWDSAYAEPELWIWLFSQHRQQ